MGCANWRNGRASEAVDDSPPPPPAHGPRPTAPLRLTHLLKCSLLFPPPSTLITVQHYRRPLLPRPAASQPQSPSLQRMRRLPMDKRQQTTQSERRCKTRRVEGCREPPAACAPPPDSKSTSLSATSLSAPASSHKSCHPFER